MSTPRDIHRRIRVDAITGRYLPPSKLHEVLPDLLTGIEPIRLGLSVRGREIIAYKLGRGRKRILMWSQMHGNEATTTKAVLDLTAYLLREPQGGQLLENLELMVLPMLNPDGARAYTRENAAGKDLNRDAAECSQPEMRVLQEAYREFKPHFCFNLHDQRTIYNVGATRVPATLSFLAPAADAARNLTPARISAMQLIAALQADLANELPGGIGRYDDTFNPNCIGDHFQEAGTPTLLFEAGHYPQDYPREQTRYFVWHALVQALTHIAAETFKSLDTADYERIPENGKDFVDVLILHPNKLNERYSGKDKLAVQYREVLLDGRIHWVPEWPETHLSRGLYGHKVYDASLEADRNQLASDALLAKLIL